MALLRVSNVSKSGDDGQSILQGIHFTQRKGQKLVIAGETGSGKSSLLKIVAGLLQPNSGELFFNDKRITGPDEQLVPGHPAIAYLSQHFELPKSLRVEQVLAYANAISDDEADLVFEICRIHHLLRRRTDELSGGEKQRIAIARLLISAPQLLLLDEPYSHLDMAHKSILKAVIREIGEKLKITLVLVSHDPADTLSWADKIIVLRNGKIIQKGVPQAIYEQPADEYVAGLFGKYNILSRDELDDVLDLSNAKKKFEWAIIRPESIRLSDRKKGIRAKVDNVVFYGSFYEVHISMNETQLFLYDYNSNLNQDDNIYIAIDSDRIALLP